MMSTARPLDLERLVAVTRRRLARRRRVEGLLEGLVLGAAGAVLAAVWQAAVDPAHPWGWAAMFIVTAAVLPYLVHAGRVGVSAEEAAWYLDRRCRAGGRLLALAEAGDAFRAPLEREVGRLDPGAARAGYGRVGRRAMWLGVGLAGLALVRLLAPASPLRPDRAAIAAETAQAASRAAAADQLAIALARRGEARLADGLAEAAPRLRRGAAGDAGTARLARVVEVRLRREAERAAIRRSLGDTPEGRALARRLTGAGTGGAAVTRPRPEAAAALERAAADRSLSAEIRRSLTRAADAVRRGDPEAFSAAASAAREALGAALSPELLAEASELLASLERGGAIAVAGLRAREKPGNEGHRAVRDPSTTELVFDPDLRRVIRRYFERRVGND